MPAFVYCASCTVDEGIKTLFGVVHGGSLAIVKEWLKQNFKSQYEASLDDLDIHQINPVLIKLAAEELEAEDDTNASCTNQESSGTSHKYLH